jgi:hypothetical protein
LFIRSSDRSNVCPIVHGSFVRSSKLSFSCRYASKIPIVRSFYHSIVHRSFIVPIHRSSFVHSPYSSFVHTTIQLHYSPLLFTITIHRHYLASLLFIEDIYNYFFVVTIHRYYSSIIRSPQISTTHPSCFPVHLRPYSSHTNSSDCDFPSSREPPIWSPIPGFSKLSTLNFEIPSNQASKLRFQ